MDNLEKVFLAVMVWKNLFVAGKDEHQYAAAKEGFLAATVDDQDLLAVVMDMNFLVVAVVMGRNFLVVAVVVGQQEKFGFLVVADVDTNQHLVACQMVVD